MPFSSLIGDVKGRPCNSLPVIMKSRCCVYLMCMQLFKSGKAIRIVMMEKSGSHVFTVCTFAPSVCASLCAPCMLHVCPMGRKVEHRKVKGFD